VTLNVVKRNLFPALPEVVMDFVDVGHCHSWPLKTGIPQRKPRPGRAVFGFAVEVAPTSGFGWPTDELRSPGSDFCGGFGMLLGGVAAAACKRAIRIFIVAHVALEVNDFTDSDCDKQELLLPSIGMF